MNINTEVFLQITGEPSTIETSMSSLSVEQAATAHIYFNRTYFQIPRV